MPSTPTREDAWALLNEFTDNPSLLKHALAVEAAMAAYARRFGEDEEAWRTIGLFTTSTISRIQPRRPTARGNSDSPRARVAGGVGTHGGLSCGLHGSTARHHRAKTLFAVDELTGFLTACALVRPDKAISEVKMKSVKKKLKDKAFARGVNREDVRRCRGARSGAG